MLGFLDGIGNAVGSLGQGLTKPIVTSNGQQITLPSDLAALQLAGKLNAGTIQPTQVGVSDTIAQQPVASTVPGTPAPAAPVGNATPGAVDSPGDQGEQVAQASTPSFGQANPSTGLTTKGNILNMLLHGAEGAVAGSGQMTMGEGFQKGMMLPYEMNQQAANNALAQQRVQGAGLQNQLTQAEVADIPQKNAAMQAETNLKNAEAGFYGAGRNYGTPEARAAFATAHPEFFAEPGSAQNYALYGNKAAPIKPQTPEERAATIQEINSKYPPDQQISPQDAQMYILNGKTAAPKNGQQPTMASLALEGVMGNKPAMAAAKLIGQLSRPNYALGNEQSKTNDVDNTNGDAATLVAAHLHAAGGNAQMALNSLDAALAGATNLSPQAKQAAHLAQLELIRQAQAERAHAGSLNSILQGIPGATPPGATVPLE